MRGLCSSGNRTCLRDKCEPIGRMYGGHKMYGGVGMGKFKDTVTRNLVGRLAMEGERIINDELSHVSYKHDTYNLHDSYGYGVYVDGVLVKQGTTLSKAKEKRTWYGKELSGHEVIVDYLKNRYKPNDGIDLVVVAVMPYGEILQDKQGYEVIAVAVDRLQGLAKKIKGAKVQLISRGKTKNVE